MRHPSMTHTTCQNNLLLMGLTYTTGTRKFAKYAC